MAKIREYVQQVPVPGVVNYSSAQAGPAAGVGAALGELGNTGASIANSIAEKQIQKSVWDAELSSAEGENYWAQRLVDAKREAPEGAEGFTESIQQEFQDWQSKALTSATTVQAQQLLKNKYSRLGGSITQDAMKFEAASFSAQQTRRLSESLSQFQNRVRANPDQLYDVEKKASELLNGTPWLDNQTKSKMEREFVTNLYGSGLDGLVSQYEVEPVTIADVSALISDLKEGKRGFLNNTDPKDFDNALTRLERRKLTIDNEHKANVSLYLQDTLTSIALHGRDPGLLTNDGIRAAYKDDPGHADRVIKQIDQAKVYYGIKQQVALTTPQQDAAMLNALKNSAFGVAATSAAANYSDYETVVRNKQRALFNDPFAYVVENDPAIANDLQQTSGNPDLFRDVLERINITQGKLGVPEWRRDVLGKGAAQETVVKLNALSPEQAANQLEIMAQQYGPKWGNAMRELAEAKLNPAFMTLARLDGIDDSVVRKDLASALQTSTDVLRKNVGSEIASDVTKEVRSNMEEFGQTIRFDGKTGQEVFSAEMASAEALALLYVQRGEDADDAAEKAVNSLLNDRYDYEDTYRTPKGMGDKTFDVLSDVLSNLTIDDFNPARGGDPSLSEEYRKNAAMRIALDEGIWLNNPAGNGVQLYAPDDTTAMGYSAVILSNGKPLSMTFDEVNAYQRKPYDFYISP